MDLNKIIAELQIEKQRLDEAILALERLAPGQAKRRGRPPRWAAPKPPDDPPPIAKAASS